MSFVVLGIGIIVAALAHWLLGGLWYSPVLFGNKWLELGKVQINPEKMKTAMYHGIIISFVMAAVLAYVMNQFLIHTIASAVWFAFEIWLGFIATVTAYSVVYDNKPKELYVLNNGYNLLGLLLMAVILTFFI